ncbi:hypothetical protein HU200_003638 [Digitaria exilis]|uniref:Rx N-terminal domain-containing protein n=1 Tax=Digitaria exilis TaxID=1010633 RepID=A0A835KVS0_9POAL|nr:hypothetical protein HU200_003638 [Digitaria exilis]
MEALLSAVSGDLIGRLVSFLISKLQQEQAGSSTDDDVGRLRRALQRARVVVEEAELRQVTNRAMLLQLHHLRAEMCRGSYVLDAFIMRRAIELASHHRRRESRRGTCGGLSAVVESMEAALSDMRELVVLLGCCPRVIKQPYSSYLFMERCMFGRQMEKEHIIGFLLQPAPDSELDVLPIIGPHEVGKRTLVEHACLDERVRQRFAKIHRLRSEDLDLDAQSPKEALQGLMGPAQSQRSLVIIDLAGGDKDEEIWRRFHSSFRRRAHRDSKVIIISRTEAHSGLGTVPPLRLRELRREELWYFFRAMAFGGADPDEHPELVRIAMALFGGILMDNLAPIVVVNKIAALLRADLSARSWRHVLKVSARVATLQLDDAIPAAGHGGCLEDKMTGVYYPRLPVKGGTNCSPCLFYHRRKSTGMPRSELPTVTMLELSQHGVVPGVEKPFDVLVWQSRIPPYASYVATCDIERAAQVEIGKNPRLFLHKRRRDQSYCGSSGWEAI